MSVPISVLAAEWPDEVSDKLATALAKAAFDCQGAIVDRITNLGVVDTGTFRANWFISADKETDRVEHYENAPSNPSTNIDGKVTAGSTVYIQNNLEYAEALEAGHSNKAPQGIVAPMDAVFKDILEGHLEDALQ